MIRFFPQTYFFNVLLLLACMGAGAGTARADSTTQALPPWMAEATDWTDDAGHHWKVPFVIPDGHRENLLSEVILPDSLGDSLYIVLEGVAWKTELILNGHYLGVWEDAFRPWIVSIPAHLRVKGKNRIRLLLSTGAKRQWYPTAFTGIHRPVRCMGAAGLRNWKKSPMADTNKADTVALVAPWYRANAYKFDPIEAALIFRAVMDKRIRTVYFLFEPGKELEQWCHEMGFQRIRKIPSYARVFWVNAYPYERDQVDFSPPFSLDEKGRRTANYGNIYPAGKTTRYKQQTSISWLLSLIILFPIVSVLLLKLLNPGFFSSLSAMLLNPRIFIDNLADISLGGGGMPFVLVMVRWLAGGFALCLTLYYIGEHHLWQWLKPFGREGLLFQWIYPGIDLGTLMLRSLLVSGLVIGYKIAVRVVLGIGFDERRISENGLNLDAIGVLPLQLLLILPAALLLFSQPGMEPWLIGGGIALGVGFLLRQIYVTYLGLNRMFAFSNTLNFLYICGLIALPYCIWF